MPRAFISVPTSGGRPIPTSGGRPIPTSGGRHKDAEKPERYVINKKSPSVLHYPYMLKGDF
ncbi:MAG: hypothetical protein IPO25_17085 [Saprospiraceae bacterium]|nr:hypothetical protein [Saprospiraceae bacterium]